ncbi:MAG: cytochrome c biogenesis CcdA family protein [Boseongicola sp.]|nr:cytochrome c biogenesis CcdA family protein [Boseongicola sp.]MDD9978913.1 cytochrome c biogenesis CcdA family protein [Boseongicola sp.]
MELVLGYFAGLLTLINPCVLPILPIVLATSLQAGRSGPLVLALGLSLSFVTLGLFVTVLGRAFGISEEMVANTGAVLMVGFGLVLLVPQFSERFATATAGFASHADAGLDNVDRSGLTGQFVAGVLLGAVWSPCIGPTLGGAISLASQGESLLWAAAIMTTFALGVSTIILALGYGAQSVIRQRQSMMRRLAVSARPLMGAVFVLVGLGILFKVHHALDAWLLDNLPTWITDLSVAI